MPDKPLSGVRVLDFTWVRAGPWATRWLAILGADILKVEWPEPALGTSTGRSVSRAANTTPAGVAPGINTDGDFSDTNVCKRSVTINARSPKGLTLLKRLLADCDVVMENFSTGLLASWGLSYDEMVKIKPDIIYISMAGLGQTGRTAHYGTMGPLVQALSGLTHLSGLPGAPSAGWGWSYMDNTGGLYADILVLSALHHRNATGEGQYIDFSQVASGMLLTGAALLDYTVNGRPSRREGFPPGNRTVWPGAPLLNNYRGPMAAPHNAYRTAGDDYNAWCAIACFSDREWRALVAVMGSPAWANDERFAGVTGRIEHQEDLDQGIEVWTKTIDKYDLMERCQAAGVRAMPVQSNLDRVEHDPQLSEQHMYTTVHHAFLGDHLTQNPPFTFSEMPTPVFKSGPLAGENNLEILGGMLGLSGEEIRAGYEDGTFWPKTIPLEPYLLEAIESAAR